jgi:dipeptidyl aminopeptidase/acylaminoacyl peptidase
MTASAGRKNVTSYRYVRLDPEEKFIKRNDSLLLKTFNFKDKSAGFATIRLPGGEAPKRLLIGAYDFSNPAKAKNDSTLILLRNNFVEPPEIYVAGPSLGTLKRISDSNPQQKNYRWGTVKLTTWTSGDGKPIDGLLYQPDNFDPRKKYPMIVYFYERNSDLLHRYFAPAPSASTVNIPLYVSRGYLVFVPDIRYKVGHPGQSALDGIVPGVKKLIAAGFVDPARIGIQGQSWGGYQVAFLITRTKMFSAAMAGAAVSNMTSAYGGIRWESGISRMFQYEKSQSRIGATLWQNPRLFVENSPLFKADRVTTPLLMMNNDADGAVPWYQGIEFFTALRRLGRPVWMLNYNNEAHNLVQRKNRKDLSIRMQQFFDHYLKDEPMPVWMRTGIPAVDKGKTLGYELSNQRGTR